MMKKKCMHCKNCCMFSICILKILRAIEFNMIFLDGFLLSIESANIDQPYSFYLFSLAVSFKEICIIISYISTTPYAYWIFQS